MFIFSGLSRQDRAERFKKASRNGQTAAAESTWKGQQLEPRSREQLDKRSKRLGNRLLDERTKPADLLRGKIRLADWLEVGTHAKNRVALYSASIA